MDPERWKEIERLCQSALEMERGKREAWLKQACAGDESLRREVEALLEQQAQAEGFLKEGAIDDAAKVLAGEKANALASELKGRTISHYRVIEKIGQGGMGEVFLAEDTSLHRKVALKFLPPEMQEDPVAHRRLLREAQSAAALDHPNICHINEVVEFEGRVFIVMEFVDGLTLQDRLARGPLPLKEAIRIAGEIAEALEEAHEKQIIHRDLKPANIMLTRKGHTKVMDFGLAKQLIPPGGIESQEKSITALTRTGMTLGTLAYMSPEQLRGESVDARSDIFSFGIVLYEMLAGVHPFKKETGMDTASAILKDAPKPLADPHRDVPVLLQHIVKKMLAKDPRNRYPSIHDLQTDLMELLENADPTAKVQRRWLKPMYWIAAIALVAVGAGSWTLFRLFLHEAALPPARIIPITTFPGYENRPQLSPDGNRIVFQWNGEEQDNWDIYVKELEGHGFNRLTTDPALDCCPAWSPDGRQIAFLRASGDQKILYLASPLGGGEKKVTDLGSEVRFVSGLDGGRLSWSPDGKGIAFRYRQSPEKPPGIWLLSPETLQKRQMTHPDAGILGDFSPAFSPDGRYLAFIRGFETTHPAIYTIRLTGGEPKLVTAFKGPRALCWNADSREIIFTGGGGTETALWRVSMDGGEAQRIPTRGDLVSQPTVSGNRLAYANGAGNSDIWKLDIGRGTMKPPSKPLFSWSSSELDQRISPDGQRIAFASNSSGTREIWVCDADGKNPTKLTNMDVGGSPDWSPDGKWIAFDCAKFGNLDIYVVSAEGGPASRITTDDSEEAVPRWSRDGSWIYFGSNRGGKWGIWKVPSGGGKAIQITQEGGMVSRESRDERFVYYYGYYGNQKKGIWRALVTGGPETLILDRVIYPFDWDLTDRGIYFIDGSSKPVANLCFYDFAGRAVKILAPVHSDPGFRTNEGLSVSPDEKWLIYSGGIYTSDIMMIDNFR